MSSFFGGYVIAAAHRLDQAVHSRVAQTPLLGLRLSGLINTAGWWGKKFEQDFGRSLALRVELLGAANDAQNGV
jgi:hypothetical protein